MKLRRIESLVLAGAMVLSTGSLVFADSNIKMDNETNLEYGIITDFDSSKEGALIKILNQDEKIYSNMELDFDEDEFLGYDNEDDFRNSDIIGDVIKYSVNTDGEVDYIEKILDLDDDMKFEINDIKFEDNYKVKKGMLTDDIENGKLELDNNNFDIKSDVIIFDISEVENISDIEDIEILSLKSLEDKGEGAHVNIFYNDDDEVEMMILNSDDMDKTEYIGYILDGNQKSDNTLVDIYDIDSGKMDEDIVVAELNSSLADEKDYINAKERAVVYTKNIDGELEIFTNQQDFEDVFEDRDYEFVTGKVIEDSSSRIKIKDASGRKESITLNANTATFETDEKVDISDIDTDDIVTIIKKGKKAKLIKIYDMSEESDQEIAKENGWDESDEDEYIIDVANDLIEDAKVIIEKVDNLKESKKNLEDALNSKDKDEIKDCIEEIKEDLEFINNH
ncbi:MAG: hypothetical protein N4A54_00600 [Peptostreptococcaceae bacterium]|nr:hypothetical protein [Peptostreptococcaceae bacterium]